jgi:hypothetical protein
MIILCKKENALFLQIESIQYENNNNPSPTLPLILKEGSMKS